MKKFLLILLLMVVPIKAQHTFSDTEILAIANNVAELQRQDSLKTVALFQAEDIISSLDINISGSLST